MTGRQDDKAISFCVTLSEAKGLALLAEMLRYAQHDNRSISSFILSPSSFE